MLDSKAGRRKKVDFIMLRMRKLIVVFYIDAQTRREVNNSSNEGTSGNPSPG